MPLAADPGRLLEAVASFGRDRRIPGLAAAVVGRGGAAWTDAWGYADLGREVPAGPQTVFRVGSVTKTLTAAAVMQLRDEGRLHLNDPLCEHLPELRTMVNPWGRVDEVTIRRVLTHEAGLPVESPAFDWGSGRFPTTDEVLASLAGVELPVPPDAQVKYSNLGYQLLGEVIARCTGGSYQQRVRDALLEPLGMAHSSFAPPPDAQMAVGHWPAAFTDRPEPAPERPKATDADGGLYSTVADLAMSVSLQFAADPTKAAMGEILSPRTLAEMHRPRHVLDASWTRAMGIGWRVFWREEGVRVGHSGSTFGFASQVLFAPRQGVGAVVLANGETKVAALAERLIDIATAADGAARGAAMIHRSEVPEPVPAAYEEYLGLYAWEDHTILVRVEWSGGRLVLSWLEEEPHLAVQYLEPAGPVDRFLVHGGRESGEELLFTRDQAGAVRGFVGGGWPHVKLISAPG